MANIKHHRVTSVSALLVVSFLLLFALNPEAFSALVDTTYAWSATHFGLFWQVFMLANFVIALVVATRPGEICLPGDEFYSFDEKYSSTSHSTTRLDVTDLSAEQVETIRHLALKAFRQLKLKDLSRVDFFLTAEGEILLNEINTFPGMTPISMFPKMLQHHGHDFGQFLHQRILAAVGQ